MVPIIELIKALVLGFTIGISAALIPGPMMFATIGISLKKGWKAGLYVFSGHALVELGIFMLILLGAVSIIGESMISYIAIIGGVVMFLFGLVIIKSAKEAARTDIISSATKFDITSGPVSAGIVTSILNPTLIIWWLTAGSAIILQEYMTGIIAVSAFIAGHWIADAGFLLAVSSSFSKGKELISPRTHERVLYICGGFLAIFGLWFLLNYNDFSSMI
ncbi:LysE family transporter [uncultured Methanomethylovorans sp.]|uniref:LysE family translocator n=1 Tax=uncultured Methanomethylovorans sp. TaxID=183759 RepID=UPI002AA79E25|nr:LysE family transporter [uncultured Methanomethylovorans sp.]